MKRLISEKTLFFSLIMCFASGVSAGVPGYTDNGKKFFSKDHPKAFGYNVEIKYPNTWKATEGVRPHAVQNFKSGDGSICVFMINKGPYSLSPEEWESFAKENDWRDYMASMSSDDGRVIENINITPTKYDGNPGIIAEFSTRMTRAGFDLYAQNVWHMFFYKDSMFGLLCGTGGLSEKNVKSKISQDYVLFRLMGNDIVLHDRYNNSQTVSANYSSDRFIRWLGWLTGVFLVSIYNVFKKRSDEKKKQSYKDKA